MDEVHKRVLLKNYIRLKQDLSPVDDLLDILLSFGTLNPKMKKNILFNTQFNVERDGEDQAGRLLDELPGCGKAAFANFITALRLAEKQAHRDLAETLCRDLDNVHRELAQRSTVESIEVSTGAGYPLTQAGVTEASQPFSQPLIQNAYFLFGVDQKAKEGALSEHADLKRLVAFSLSQGAQGGLPTLEGTSSSASANPLDIAGLVQASSPIDFADPPQPIALPVGQPLHRHARQLHQFSTPPVSEYHPSASTSTIVLTPADGSQGSSTESLRRGTTNQGYHPLHQAHAQHERSRSPLLRRHSEPPGPAASPLSTDQPYQTSHSSPPHPVATATILSHAVGIASPTSSGQVPVDEPHNAPDSTPPGSCTLPSADGFRGQDSSSPGRSTEMPLSPSSASSSSSSGSQSLGATTGPLVNQRERRHPGDGSQPMRITTVPSDEDMSTFMESVTGVVVLNNELMNDDRVNFMLPTLLKEAGFDPVKIRRILGVTNQDPNSTWKRLNKSLIHAEVDGDFGDPRFQVAQQQLERIVNKVTQRRGGNVKTLDGIPRNSVALLLLADLEAVLTLYQYAIHFAGFLAGIGVMQLRAIGRRMTLDVWPPSPDDGSDPQLASRTRSRPRLLQRLEDGGLLPHGFAAGGLSQDSVLMRCSQYALADCDRMDKLLDVLHDELELFEVAERVQAVTITERRHGEQVSGTNTEHVDAEMTPDTDEDDVELPPLVPAGDIETGALPQSTGSQVKRQQRPLRRRMFGAHVPRLAHRKPSSGQGQPVTYEDSSTSASDSDSDSSGFGGGTLSSASSSQSLVSVHASHASKSSSDDGSVSEDSMYSSAMEGSSKFQHPASIQRFRKILQRRYVQETVEADIGMLPEGVRPSVENIAVDVVMLPWDDLRAGFTDQAFGSLGDLQRVEHVFSTPAWHMESMSLADVFHTVPLLTEHGHGTVGVLVSGSAGCGKTFMFKKVFPLKWATGQLFPQFDLVFAREFRLASVRRATGIVELLGLSSLLIGNTSDLKDVCDYIAVHPERVCIVLDGLDETSLADCSEFVRDIIGGNLLKGIQLVVTCRPYADLFRLSEMAHFIRHVELVGFSPDGVKQYIQKVLKPEMAAALLDTVHQDPKLAGIMTMPFLALAVCQLLHRTETVPRCVSDIFEMLIMLAFEHRTGKRYTTWPEVPARLKAAVLELGRFAFLKMCQQQGVFSESDFQELSVPVESLALGLLVSCDPVMGDTAPSLRFSHLAMQEFLAAKYQANLLEMKPVRIIRLVETLGPLSGHLQTFWALLAAQLSHFGADHLCNALLTRNLESDTPAEQDTWNPASFPQNISKLLSSFINTEQMHHLTEALLVNKENSIGGTDSIQQQQQQQQVMDDAEHGTENLEALLAAWVERAPDADETVLLSALQRIDSSLATRCTEALGIHPVVNDSVRQNLAFACFEEHSLSQLTSPRPFRSITKWLSRNNGVVQFQGHGYLRRSLMTGTVVQHHASHVSEVRLSGLSFGIDSTLLLSLAKCTSLVGIDVHDCHGVSSFIANIIDPSSASLKVLTVRRSAIPVEGMVDLCRALSSCTKLEDLTLSYVALSPEAVPPMATMFSSPANIRRLIIEGLPCLGDSLTDAVCQSLSHSTNLRILWLSGCGLTPSSLTIIAQHISEWARLFNLNLSGNDFDSVTDNQVDSFITAVSRCGSLTSLCLPGQLSSSSHSFQRLTDSSAYPPRITLRTVST